MASGQAMMANNEGSKSPGQHPFKATMVCTNLDGTLLGDDRSMYELLNLTERGKFLLVFDSGRDIPSVDRLIERKNIQKPDAVICMVGTEVYFAGQGEFHLDQRWSEIISRGWHRQKILELMQDIQELRWQDSRWQTNLKVSYLLKENQQTVLKEIDRRLEEAQLEAKVVYSCNQFLDFLPIRSGKSGALSYITGKLGIGKQDVVVCGNTGNDLDLFEAGYKGIIVGNADPELRSYMGENAYHATSWYAAGIIEGLRHFEYLSDSAK